MVAAFEHQHARPPRGVPRELHRRLHSLGAGVPEEERVEALVRHDPLPPELLAELQHAPVVRDVHLAVDELAALLLRRRHDLGVACGGNSAKRRRASC